MGSLPSSFRTFRQRGRLAISHGPAPMLPACPVPAFCSLTQLPFEQRSASISECFWKTGRGQGLLRLLEPDSQVVTKGRGSLLQTRHAPWAQWCP